MGLWAVSPCYERPNALSLRSGTLSSVGALTERPQETSAGGNSAEDPQNTTASVAISDVSAAVEAAEVIGGRSMSAPTGAADIAPAHGENDAAGAILAGDLTLAPW